MAKAFSGAEFVKALSEGNLKAQLIKEGLAKQDPEDKQAILFSEGRSCGEWVRIPLEMVESVEYLGAVPCRDHEHPFVRLHIKEPSDDNRVATAFAALLRSSSRRASRTSGVGNVFTPQASWQNCSADGSLCYYCSDDGGVCVCNWFYNGQWIATTDCGSSPSPDEYMQLLKAESLNPQPLPPRQSVRFAGRSPAAKSACPPRPLPAGSLVQLAERQAGLAAAASPIPFSWPTQHSGDCTMSNAVLTLFPDGRATFSAVVQSSSPSFFGGDYYHLWLTVRDGANNPIVNLPEITSPNMPIGSGPTSWNASIGSFPAIQSRFGDIRSADGSQSC